MKRISGPIFRINQLYSGKFLELPTQTVFMLNDKAYPRIRVFGIVIERIDRFENVDRPYVILTIDDGSDTIRVKLWQRAIKTEEEEYVNNLDMVKDIKVGDIIDVLGKVREFDGEYFISPVTINKEFDMDSELLRRSQLIKIELNNGQLLEEEQPVFGEEPQSLPQNDDFYNAVYDAILRDSSKNTVDQIASRLGIAEELVREQILKLHQEAKIIETREGQYERIDFE